MSFEWNASRVKIPLKNSRIINKYAQESFTRTLIEH